MATPRTVMVVHVPLSRVFDKTIPQISKEASSDLFLFVEAAANLILCSAKESTAFTVQAEMNRQGTEHSHFKRK